MCEVRPRERLAVDAGDHRRIDGRLLMRPARAQPECGNSQKCRKELGLHGRGVSERVGRGRRPVPVGGGSFGAGAGGLICASAASSTRKWCRRSASSRKRVNAAVRRSKSSRVRLLMHSMEYERGYQQTELDTAGDTTACSTPSRTYLRAPDERWQLKRGQTYWVRLGHLHKHGPDKPLTINARTAPVRVM